MLLTAFFEVNESKIVLPDVVKQMGFRSIAEYLDGDDIRYLSTVLPKMSDYVKTFDEIKFLFFRITKNDVGKF